MHLTAEREHLLLVDIQSCVEFSRKLIGPSQIIEVCGETRAIVRLAANNYGLVIQLYRLVMLPYLLKDSCHIGENRSFARLILYLIQERKELQLVDAHSILLLSSVSRDND